MCPQTPVKYLHVCFFRHNTLLLNKYNITEGTIKINRVKMSFSQLFFLFLNFFSWLHFCPLFGPIMLQDKSCNSLTLSKIAWSIKIKTKSHSLVSHCLFFIQSSNTDHNQWGPSFYSHCCQKKSEFASPCFILQIVCHSEIKCQHLNLWKPSF